LVGYPYGLFSFSVFLFPLQSACFSFENPDDCRMGPFPPSRFSPTISVCGPFAGNYGGIFLLFFFLRSTPRSAFPPKVIALGFSRHFYTLAYRPICYPTRWAPSAGSPSPLCPPALTQMDLMNVFLPLRSFIGGNLSTGTQRFVLSPFPFFFLTTAIWSQVRLRGVYQPHPLHFRPYSFPRAVTPLAVENGRGGSTIFSSPLSPPASPPHRSSC